MAFDILTLTPFNVQLGGVDPNLNFASAMHVLQRGIDSGELREVNLFETVHVLIFPMLMLCLHKHSLGACAHVREMMDPQKFIRTHVDVVMRGLIVRPDAGAPARPKDKKPKRVE